MEQYFLFLFDILSGYYYLLSKSNNIFFIVQQTREFYRKTQIQNEQIKGFYESLQKTNPAPFFMYKIIVRPFVFEDQQFEVVFQSESMKQILKNEITIQDLIKNLKYFYSYEQKQYLGIFLEDNNLEIRDYAIYQVLQTFTFNKCINFKYLNQKIAMNHILQERGDTKHRPHKQSIFKLYKQELQANDERISVNLNISQSPQMSLSKDFNHSEKGLIQEPEDENLKKYFEQIKVDDSQPKSFYNIIITKCIWNSELCYIITIHEQQEMLANKESEILSSSQMQLEKKNQGQMLANITHDLKTPLNSMVAIIQHLEQEKKYC